ncbi:MAG: hypothetical protein A4E29_01473 [Methanomassiliicoccales archaeon PtaB.Bin134]|nr:MAG: hypothetical protein A4E29_01473 [Methanomassiliicoccales archaeon PtaB.Bin134]
MQSPSIMHPLQVQFAAHPLPEPEGGPGHLIQHPAVQLLPSLQHGQPRGDLVPPGGHALLHQTAALSLNSLHHGHPPPAQGVAAEGHPGNRGHDHMLDQDPYPPGSGRISLQPVPVQRGPHLPHGVGQSAPWNVHHGGELASEGALFFILPLRGGAHREKTLVVHEAAEPLLQREVGPLPVLSVKLAQPEGKGPALGHPEPHLHHQPGVEGLVPHIDQFGARSDGQQHPFPFKAGHHGNYDRLLFIMVFRPDELARSKGLSTNHRHPCPSALAIHCTSSPENALILLLRPNPRSGMVTSVQLRLVRCPS